MDRVFIASFLGSLIVTATGEAIVTRLERVPNAFSYILDLLFAVVAVWLVSVLIRVAISVVTHGRYAVEAFILDANNNLLLYYHPYLKKQIPPGGRVSLFEFPHAAIVRHLEQRLGLKREAYQFMTEFHHGLSDSTGNLGSVERVPAPFLVQRELRRQRFFVRFHYDFIYVLRLVDSNVPSPDSRYSPVHFVTLEDLVRVVTDHRSLPDVQNAYEKILRRLHSGTSTS